MRKKALILIPMLALIVGITATALAAATHFASKDAKSPGWSTRTVPPASTFSKVPDVVKAKAAVTRATNTKNAVAAATASRKMQRIIEFRQQKALEAVEAMAANTSYKSCGERDLPYSLGKSQVAVLWKYDYSIGFNPGSTGLPEGDAQPWYTGGSAYFIAPDYTDGYILGSLPGVSQLVQIVTCHEYYKWVSTGEWCEIDEETGEEWCWEDGYYELMYSEINSTKTDWNGQPNTMVAGYEYLEDVDGFRDLGSAATVLKVKIKKKN